MNNGFRNAPAIPPRGVVQRSDGSAAAGQSAGAAGSPAMSGIDLEELVERVYRRWLEELRIERERGGW